MRAGDPRGALAALDAAQSLQPDQTARVLLGTVVSKRALVHLELGDRERAVTEAADALDRWRENSDSRFVLATVAAEQGLLDDAEELLDEPLRLHPDDEGARALLRRVRPRGTAPDGR
jgi:tetratricopeptide (TPR) repeat protein